MKAGAFCYNGEVPRDWETGREIPDYEGEIVIHFKGETPALFKTWIDENGERNFVCLKAEV